MLGQSRRRSTWDRSIKLVSWLKNKCYKERLIELKLQTLKYIRIRGNMIWYVIKTHSLKNFENVYRLFSTLLNYKFNYKLQYRMFVEQNKTRRQCFSDTAHKCQYYSGLCYSSCGIRFHSLRPISLLCYQPTLQICWWHTSWSQLLTHRLFHKRSNTYQIGLQLVT